MAVGIVKRRAPLLVALTALTALIVPVSATAQTTIPKPTTVTVCVNKKTGAMQYRSARQAKKKCKKGWQKVSWSVTGPAGPAGPAGPGGPAGPSGTPPVVKAANGQTLGLLVGAGFSGAQLAVLVDGGAYYFGQAGKLQSSGFAYWTTAGCTGQAYLDVAGGSENPQDYEGIFRAVYRSGSGTSSSPYGIPRAWTGNGGAAVAFENLTTQLYFLTRSGSCVAVGGSFSLVGMPLKEVSAPADVPGPLTIG